MTTTRVAGSTTDKAIDTSKNDSFSDPFEGQSAADTSAVDDATGTSPPSGLSAPQRTDRRMSKEWDASKVPPSRFQKPEGSIYATTNSRDGHIDRRERDSGYHAKLKEKGWM